ncbi:hypothetical protein GCM10007935_02870 [Hydrogenophaga electricum]|uniref:Uncharacterized protein n=1 Tax=Hydrogenophaga electricum TaxID=1230953 RepID=A0ABQ6BZC3_9BURK|nr:hypothetical protein GCM10007935_02870 [Hydrogenophaga electricum]
MRAAASAALGCTARPGSLAQAEAVRKETDKRALKASLQAFMEAKSVSADAFSDVRPVNGSRGVGNICNTVSDYQKTSADKHLPL